VQFRSPASAKAALARLRENHVNVQGRATQVSFGDAGPRLDPRNALLMTGLDRTTKDVARLGPIERTWRIDVASLRIDRNRSGARSCSS
jgi:hypothetical protein